MYGVLRSDLPFAFMGMYASFELILTSSNNILTDFSHQPFSYQPFARLRRRVVLLQQYWGFMAVPGRIIDPSSPYRRMFDLPREFIRKR